MQKKCLGGKDDVITSVPNKELSAIFDSCSFLSASIKPWIFSFFVWIRFHIILNNSSKGSKRNMWHLSSLSILRNASYLFNSLISSSWTAFDRSPYIKKILVWLSLVPYQCFVAVSQFPILKYNLQQHKIKSFKQKTNLIQPIFTQRTLKLWQTFQTT
jgi:hypothetical protein